MAYDLGKIAKSIALFKIPGWTEVTADQIKVTAIG